MSLVNELLPEGQRICYIPWDLQKCAKTPGANLLQELSSIVSLGLELTGRVRGGGAVGGSLGSREGAVGGGGAGAVVRRAGAGVHHKKLGVSFRVGEEGIRF